MEDFEFTFNEGPFLKSIDRMYKALGTITEGAKNFVRKITSENSKSQDEIGKKSKESRKKNQESMADAGNIVSAFTKRIAVLGGAYGLLRKAMSFMPEIGKTSQIVGDIIGKNLLWPLRQELMPLLQKQLNWVRDHRTMFVRWGSVLVNVFRVVKGWSELVVKGFQTMYTSFMKSWEGFFGKSKKTLSDWVNVFLFQLTVVLIAIQTIFEPVMRGIGTAIAMLAISAKGFFSGFIDGISSIMEPATDLINLFKEIFDEISGGDLEIDILYKSFQVLGDFLGTTLVAILHGTVSLLRGVWGVVKGIANSIIAIVESVMALSSGDFSGAANAWKNVGKEFVSDMGKAADSAGKVGGAFQKFGDRTIDRFSGAEPVASPQGTISKTSNISNTTKVDKIEIQVKDAKEGYDAGKNFVSGMTESLHGQMKKAIYKEKATMGW
jgi:hypothetical protein